MQTLDLTDQEYLALVGLVRHLVVTDGIISESEATELEALKEELGDARFTAAWRRAQTRFPRAQDAIDFAAEHVHRASARELVVTILSDVAVVDEYSDAERLLVGKVRLMWGLFAPDDPLGDPRLSAKRSKFSSRNRTGR